MLPWPFEACALEDKNKPKWTAEDGYDSYIFSSYSPSLPPLILPKLLPYRAECERVHPR